MCAKRSSKRNAKNNFLLDFSDAGEKPDYLSMIESISYDVEECGLLFEILSDQESLLSLSDFLFLSHEQAAIFSVIAELSLREDVTIDVLARFFKCKVVRILSLLDQIEAMEARGLVKCKVNAEKRKETYRDLTFTIPKNVMEALRRADQRLLETNRTMNFPAMLDYTKQLLREREDDTLSPAQLLREAEELIAQNKQLPFVHYLNSRLEKTSSKVVVLCLVMDHFNGKMETAPEYFSDILFDNFRDQIEFSRNVHSGRHELISKGVASLSKGSPHEGRCLMLGAEAQRLLFIDFPEQIMSESSQDGLITHCQIKEKTLIFNPVVAERFSELEKMLGINEFQRFMEEAQKNKMNPGITAIFFGQPGTGKTELALQLAKKTRRDLFMVDLSQTRSMWFGESEKQVKRIFENYRELLKNKTPEPILFINEADGLLSRRLEIGNASTPIAHTQNLIQNILLQELEQFKGILIATSNLTGNLDKAFERRFLLKIDFPKPDQAVRQQIWLSKLPELTPEMAATLAHRFDFTGGQIDNQVKQLLIKRVLHPDADLLQTLIETCEKELGFTERKRIGFN